MPILATGSRRLARDAGVSLIEALMALMIVSLMAGAVVLLSGAREQQARVEAERLAARIELAREESVIANRAMALSVTAEGYGFERYVDGRWVATEHGSPLSFRPWPREIEARVEQSEFGEEDEGRVARFDVLGGAGEASILLSRSGVGWRVRVSGEGQTDVTRAE
jgi:general secretion pathway protein H